MKRDLLKILYMAAKLFISLSVSHDFKNPQIKIMPKKVRPRLKQNYMTIAQHEIFTECFYKRFVLKSLLFLFALKFLQRHPFKIVIFFIYTKCFFKGIPLKSLFSLFALNPFTKDWFILELSNVFVIIFSANSANNAL